MLETMRIEKTLLAAAVFLLPFCAVSQSTAHPRAVTLTPPLVEAGSPELIKVEAPSASAVDGAWMGRKLQFFRGSDGSAWFALAGVDVEGAVGSSTLQVIAHQPQGETRDLSLTVEIHAAHYRTGKLSVAPQFVAPGLEALARIKEEAALKEKIFADSAPQPLWSGSFRAPVQAAPTDSFGTRRTFNGTLASIHKGMDFRAAMGTAVKAGNNGVVVLARPLYYEGNCVVIDHGLGFYTISMHLSRIDVREGERVVTGQRLGLSGATGRVTGPHLHWAVRWQGAYLDPAKLLQLNLSAAK
jgi:murein DD-endopeptidase MepM/ murein hydrolase activator NlpD